MVVERTKSAPQIALIQMPFAVTAWPSLGLSLLRSGLGKRGISSTVYYLNLEFLKMVGHEIYQDLALGAPANTNSSGADVGEQGTYPFGESWYNNNTTSNWVYTSYERDAESGDDYALARSYANTNGRFLSPDPL